jgi:hypothetical protein
MAVYNGDFCSGFRQEAKLEDILELGFQEF